MGAGCESPTSAKTREHKLRVKREARRRSEARNAPQREAAKAERAAAREVIRSERAAAAAAIQAEREAAKIGPPITDIVRHRMRMKRPAFVVNMRMRTAINKAMRGGKAGRKWEEIVGYTLADLVEHLAARMPAGYTMADFTGGRLHIDHVKPKSLFDVTTPEGLRAAWALSNLQPLTATENLRKGSRFAFQSAE